MKETVSKAAHQADGKRRSCDKCPLRPCSNIQFKVCTEQFVEGFRKDNVECYSLDNHAYYTPKK